jgi:hypothetical protein
LKLTRPSYTDQFEFTGFVEEIDGWKGIHIKVRRLTDNKKFESLIQLKTTYLDDTNVKTLRNA